MPNSDLVKFGCLEKSVEKAWGRYEGNCHWIMLLMGVKMFSFRLERLYVRENWKIMINQLILHFISDKILNTMNIFSVKVNLFNPHSNINTYF